MKYFKRKSYGFLDLLGDIGGVTEAFILKFSIFLVPISEHIFTLKAISKLFLAKTVDKQLFQRTQNPKLLMKAQTKKKMIRLFKENE